MNNDAIARLRRLHESRVNSPAYRQAVDAALPALLDIAEAANKVRKRRLTEAGIVGPGLEEDIAALGTALRALPGDEEDTNGTE